MVLERQAVDVDREGGAFTALRALTGIAGLVALWLVRPWDFTGLGLERRGVWGTELVDLFPQSWLAVRVGCWALAAALVALVAGWHSRAAAWVALVLGVWLYGMSAGLAGVTHLQHFLLLFAVLGAARHPGWAMVAARIGVGSVYFFPGLAKLRVVADWPDILHAHIAKEQAVHATILDVVPPRPMVVAMALGAVLFELFLGVLLFTRWRRPAVAVALVFHCSTGLLMGIWFPAVVLILPAFLLPMPKPRGEVPLSLVPAGVLIVGMTVTGFAGQNYAWPVASYPKFDHAPGGTEVEEAIATTDDGDRFRVGQVLLPHHDPGYWGKLERTHPDSALDAAVEAKIGEPVTISWESV